MSLYLLASKVNSSRCHGRCDVQYREVICSDSTAFARNCLCMCNIRACSRQWFLFHASVYCARLVQPRRHKPHEANPVRQSRWLQVTSRDEQTQGKHGIELRVVESSSSWSCTKSASCFIFFSNQIALRASFPCFATQSFKFGLWCALLAGRDKDRQVVQVFAISMCECRWGRTGREVGLERPWTPKLKEWSTTELNTNRLKIWR